MASLGNLFFEVGFNMDPKELEEIKKRALEQLKELEIKFNMSVSLSKEDLAKQVNEILNKEHKVNISVDKEKLSSEVKEAISKTETDTQGISGQAEAYRDLESAINSIIGTRAQNIKRLVDEKNALVNIQSQLRIYEKQQQTGVVLNKDQLKQKASLINKEFEHKQAISELNQLIKSDVKLSQSAATSMDEMSLTLTRMKVAYKGLSDEMKLSPFGRQLEAQIQTTDTALKKMDASIGNHQRNVGNYKTQWDGLQYQVMQFTRELPSMAYGMNVFIAAISNNWPMLADEIKKANAQYKALKASQAQGLNLDKQAIPVWKQLVGGIFSWQTAALILTTVLITQWGTIKNWVSGLFSAGDAIRLTKEELKKLNEEFANTAGRDIAQLDILFDRLRKAKEGTAEWNDAKAKIINQYGDYLSGMNQEIVSLNDQAGAYRALAEAIYEATKAKVRDTTIEKYAIDRIKTVEDEYSNIRSIIEETYKKPEDKKKGETLFQNIQDQLERTGELSKEITDQIEMDFTKTGIRNVGSGAVYDESAGGISRMSRSITVITDAQDKYNKKSEETERILGFIGRETKNATIQNKAYWESQKSMYQKMLNGLDLVSDKVVDVNGEMVSLEGRKTLAKGYIAEIGKIDDTLAAYETKQKKETDTANDPLRERLNLLKEANSVYREWMAVVGKDKALSIVQDMIMPDFNPDTYREDIEKIMNSATKSKKGKDVKIDAAKTLTGLDKESIEEVLKETERHISDIVKGWDLFSQLFEKTNDYQFSINAAFGGDVTFKSVLEQLEADIRKELKGNKYGITFDEIIKMNPSKAGGIFGGQMTEYVKTYQEQSKKITDESLKNVAELLYIFRDYETKRADIIAKGEKQVADLMAHGASAKIIQESRKKTREELASLNFGEFKNSDLWSKAFEDLGRLSTGTIDSMITKLEQFKDSAGRNLPINEFKELMNILKKMRNEYESRNPFKSLITGVKEYKDALTELKRAQKDVETIKSGGKVVSSYGIDSTTETETPKGGVTVQKNVVKGLKVEYKSLEQAENDVANAGEKVKSSTDKIKDAFNNAEPYLQSFSSAFGNLSRMFEAMGNDDMADAMSGAQEALSSISNIGQGFAKGGLVGGIAAAVGEAAKWATKAFEAAARHKKALAEIMKEAIAQQRAYNLLLIRQNLEYEKASTIFGADDYGKAANSVGVLKDAISELNKELKGTEDQKNGLYSGFFGKFRELTDVNAKIKKQFAGLASIQIKTGHQKTGLFGWGKGKDIYSSILDVYPELIDANGNFNASLAQTILQTRTMSDENKAALQTMIDYSETASDALKVMQDYLTGIFGELGQSISNALVDAFRNGTNAAKSFTDSVTNMLEKLAESMIYSVTIAPYIAKAQEDMMNIMKNEKLTDAQKFSGYVAVLGGLTDDVLAGQENFNALMKDYKKRAADKGVELWKPDKSGGGLSAGIKGITEDTASLLASYVNSIRADGSINRELLTRYVNDVVPEMSAMAKAQLTQLMNISQNTAKSADNTEEIMDLLKSVSTGSKKLWMH